PPSERIADEPCTATLPMKREFVMVTVGRALAADAESLPTNTPPPYAPWLGPEIVAQLSNTTSVTATLLVEARQPPMPPSTRPRNSRMPLRVSWKSVVGLLSIATRMRRLLAPARLPSSVSCEEPGPVIVIGDTTRRGGRFAKAGAELELMPLLAKVIVPGAVA